MEKNKSLKQVSAGQYKHIPQNPQLLVELEQALQMRKPGQPCLEKNAYKNYKDIKKHLKSVFVALERIYNANSSNHQAQEDKPNHQPQEDKPIRQKRTQSLQVKIDETYYYLLNEAKLPILYEYLQRKKSHQNKRATFAEVIRYIQAFFRVLKKLINERYPGRKFFDHELLYQIPSSDQFLKMEVITEGMFEMLNKVKNLPSVPNSIYSSPSSDTSVEFVYIEPSSKLGFVPQSCHRKRSRSIDAERKNKYGSQTGSKQSLNSKKSQEEQFFKPSPCPTNHIYQFQLNVHSRKKRSQLQSSERDCDSCSPAHSSQNAEVYKLDLQLKVAVKGSRITNVDPLNCDFKRL